MNILCRFTYLYCLIFSGSWELVCLTDLLFYSPSGYAYADDKNQLSLSLSEKRVVMKNLCTKLLSVGEESA